MLAILSKILNFIIGLFKSTPSQRITMKTNQNGISLIKHYEGFRSETYIDAAGHPTIGYGHKLLDGEDFSSGISEERAEELLRKDVGFAEEAVEDLVKVPLNPNQHAALVSWTFNLGRGSLASSTLLKKLNSGDYDSVPSEMKRWNKATINGVKQELRGLTIRHESEAELFGRTFDLKPEGKPATDSSNSKISCKARVFIVSAQIDVDVTANSLDEAKLKAIEMAKKQRIEDLQKPMDPFVSIILM